MNLTAILIIYLIIINISAFIIFGIDKRRAIKKRWRIAESTLFLLALIGGSIGAGAGMYIFHHKTKHLRFVIGIPLIFIVQVILFKLFLSKPDILYQTSNILR